MVAEVTLRQLLDMSMGNPEIGVVNFNYMYSMLHIMIIRLEKLLEASFDAGILNDISLKESIQLDATSQEFTKRFNFKKSTDSFVKCSSEGDVSIESKTKEERKKLPPSGKSMLSKKTSSKSSSKKESVTFVDEDTRGSLGKNVIMTKQCWVVFQKKMKLLEDQVETLLKTDSEDILGHIQKFSPDLSTSQYIEMAHRLTQSKRMDVNEELIRQLSVMIEETNSSIEELKNQGGVVEVKSLVQKVKDIEEKETVLEESLASVEKVLGVPIKKRKLSSEDSNDFDDDDEEFELKQNIPVCHKPKKTIKELIDAKMDKETYSDITGVSPAVLEQMEQIGHGVKFIEKYRLQYELQDKIMVDLINKLDDDGYDMSDILQRKKLMEDDLTGILRDKNLLDERFLRRGAEDEEVTPLSVLNEKLEELEINLQELNQKVESISSNVGNLAFDDSHLRISIAEMQKTVDKFTDNINRIVADGLDNQKQIQEMINNIEHLRKSKANVDELVRLQEEKADSNILESAFKQFQREISSLDSKISHVGDCHQASLSSINDSIQKKLDKNEITPLKNFVNSKVKMVVVKINKLAKRSGADNPAASRKLLLKNRHRVPYAKPTEPIIGAYIVPQNSVSLMPIKQRISPYPASFGMEQKPQQQQQQHQQKQQLLLQQQQQQLLLQQQQQQQQQRQQQQQQQQQLQQQQQQQLQQLQQQQQQQQQQQPLPLPQKKIITVISKKCPFPPSTSDSARPKRSQQDLTRCQDGGSSGPTMNICKLGNVQETKEMPADGDNHFCHGGSHSLPFSYQKLQNNGRSSVSFDDASRARQEPDGGYTNKGSTMSISPVQKAQSKNSFHNLQKFIPDVITSNQQMYQDNGFTGNGFGSRGTSICLGGGAIDAPMSSIPFSNSVPSSSEENIRRVKLEKSPERPTPSMSTEKEEKHSSGIIVSPSPHGKRCSTPRKPMSSCGSPRGARQSPPPSPLGSASARSSSVGAMGAKFTTSSYSPPSRPTSGLVIKTTSGTVVQNRGSQRAVTSSPLSRTSSSGNISQLGRGRSGSRTREQDT